VVQGHHRRTEKSKESFQTLYGRVRSMPSDAGIKGEEMGRGIWAECTSTATFYAIVLVHCESGKVEQLEKDLVKWLW
jgi:hypothetical protein